MNNPNIDKNKLAKALQNALGKTAADTAVTGARKGNLSALLATLSPEDRRKLTAALADEKSTRAVLSSDQAKALLENLLGGKP